jgi:hypothetical protein
MKIAENSPHLAAMQYHLAKFGQRSMPATEDAMKGVAEYIQEVWQGFAYGGDLDGVEKLKNPSWKYARSIRFHRLGPFQYEIFSESKIAQRIEEGTPEHDMKKTHPFGPRSRVSEKGIPYLIIPFRWGTPEGKNGQRVGFKNIMPESVYSAVKKFKKMRTLVSADSGEKTPTMKGAYSDVSTKKTMYPNSAGRASYNKGYGRLKANLAENKNQVGMVRSTDDTGKDRAGGYFTFRIISAKSPASSWIRPAESPRKVRKAVVDHSRSFIEATVSAAIAEDLGL